VKSKSKASSDRLVVILGDQLDRANPLVAAVDPARDRVFMAEVREEATHVWSHKARIALFLSAMRHFRIDRMSNYCKGCRYNPAHASGEEACPFTTLYWDFLSRHRERFAHHPRTALQWRNLERLDVQTLKRIRRQADGLRG